MGGRCFSGVVTRLRDRNLRFFFLFRVAVGLGGIKTYGKVINELVI